MLGSLCVAVYGHILSSSMGLLEFLSPLLPLNLAYHSLVCRYLPDQPCSLTLVAVTVPVTHSMILINDLFPCECRFNHPIQSTSIPKNYLPQHGIPFTDIPNPPYTLRLPLESKVNSSSPILPLEPDSDTVTSLPASQYTSTSTTQQLLINVHLALERMRIMAKREGGTGRGPRVMVLGPPSSGKTTVVKNLVNMALGSGVDWSIGVVGLDPASVRLVT